MFGPFVAIGQFKTQAEAIKRANSTRYGLGAADHSAFDRHGYTQAMRTQIDYGIFDYCGAQVVTSALLLESESGGAQAHLQAAKVVGQGLFEDETVAG